jgi:hypothetical protein
MMHFPVQFRRKSLMEAEVGIEPTLQFRASSGPRGQWCLLEQDANPAPGVQIPTLTAQAAEKLCFAMRWWFSDGFEPVSVPHLFPDTLCLLLCLLLRNHQALR